MSELRVAIQGERGAFSEGAARKLVAAVEIVPCRTFDDVFEAVRGGQADAAVVPIENSLAGSVLRTYELLGGAGLEIAGETQLRISLNLIAAPGVRLEDVRRVLSHPVALAQCQRFLSDLPNVEAIATYDTAGSVKLVMESRDEAAIAGAAAAELYGGIILAASVEDNAQNYTRFFLIAPPPLAEKLRTRDRSALKTTVLFRTPNTPGSLFRALGVFALRDINLSKLESRPIEGRPREYAFYADIAGGQSEARVTNALNHLREMCETVVVLGSYGAA